jgi:hydroxypyruvate isomerase
VQARVKVRRMPRFAANLSWLFTEVPFLDRFAAAARAGFEAVEFLFPYDHAADQIAGALRAHGLANVLFNLPPGDWPAGERGIAAIPGREAEFRDSVELALAYARALGTPRLHVMSGVVPPGADRSAYRATYVANLRAAALRAARDDRIVLIEPLNPRDAPGYLVSTQAQAHAIRAEVGAANVKVQMDFYHCQIVEGDLATRLRKYLPHVGHIQIAGVPDRGEPDAGEVNYPYLFRLLDELGYAGWIGCEYRPARGTAAGLAWFEPWRVRR